VRKKMLVKVYVAGLYLARPTSDATTALAPDAPRRIVLRMMRNLDRKKLDEALTKGFVDNAGSQLPALQGRLNQLRSVLSDVHEGDVLEFTYLPGGGTVVHGNGRQITIPGKDFSDALFSIWLGNRPVDENLKRALLSARP
jgi:hypothetical protein